MALKIKTPSMSLLQTAVWVALFMAALKFALGRFGGEPGARVLRWL